MSQADEIYDAMLRFFALHQGTCDEAVAALIADGPCRIAMKCPACGTISPWWSVTTQERWDALWARVQDMPKADFERAKRSIIQ